MGVLGSFTVACGGFGEHKEKVLRQERRQPSCMVNHLVANFAIQVSPSLR